MQSNVHRKQPAISSNTMSAVPGWDVISDISFALLHYRSLCPSEKAEILQHQRHELARHRWQEGTWYAKQHNYHEVFISNRSRGRGLMKSILLSSGSKLFFMDNTRNRNERNTWQETNPQGLFDPDNLSNVLLSDCHGQVVQLTCSHWGIH